MAEVLISHDREDIAFAELVEVRLIKALHHAHLDSEISNAGDAWTKQLDRAIRKADVMVVIMTPEARASAHVTYEWAFALGAGVGVIPIELKKTPFHPRLDVLKRLDFTEKQRPWAAFLQEIVKIAGSTTTISIPPEAPPAIKNAIVALDSLDVNEQVAGVQSLAKMDHDIARQALADALEHPVRNVRMAAAVEFPDLADPRLTPGLIDRFRNEKDQWQRFLHCILSIGSPAVPDLLDALRDPSHKVRSHVAIVLGRICDTRAVAPLIGLLGDDYQPVRRAAARALGRIGEKTAAAPLLEALGDKDENVRAAVVRALGRIGHDKADELIAALEDESLWVRAAAAGALGERRVRQAVPDLLAHLRGDCAKVREAVALALGRIGDPAVLGPLVGTFQDEEEKVPVREAATQALGLLGQPGAADVLCDYLTHRQQQDRWVGSNVDFDAAEALLKLGHIESIDLVGETLGSFRSGTPPVGVVELLGSFGEEAVPALTGLLENRSLHETSARILKEIGTENARAALRQWNRSH